MLLPRLRDMAPSILCRITKQVPLTCREHEDWLVRNKCWIFLRLQLPCQSYGKGLCLRILAREAHWGVYLVLKLSLMTQVCHLLTHPLVLSTNIKSCGSKVRFLTFQDVLQCGGIFCSTAATEAINKGPHTNPTATRVYK